MPSENLRLAGSQAGDAAHRRGRICGAPTGRSAAAGKTAGGSAASRRPGRVVAAGQWEELRQVVGMAGRFAGGRSCVATSVLFDILPQKPDGFLFSDE